MDRHTLTARLGRKAPGRAQDIDQVVIGVQLIIGRSDDRAVQLYPTPPQRYEDDVALLQGDVVGHVTVQQIGVEVERDFVPACASGP